MRASMARLGQAKRGSLWPRHGELWGGRREARRKVGSDDIGPSEPGKECAQASTKGSRVRVHPSCCSRLCRGPGGAADRWNQRGSSRDREKCADIRYVLEGN